LAFFLLSIRPKKSIILLVLVNPSPTNLISFLAISFAASAHRLTHSWFKKYNQRPERKKYLIQKNKERYLQQKKGTNKIICPNCLNICKIQVKITIKSLLFN
jgi:hypothetical protein